MNNHDSNNSCREDNRRKYYCKVVLAKQKIEVESYNRRVLSFFKDYIASFDEPDFIVEAIDDKNKACSGEYPVKKINSTQDANIAEEFVGEERIEILRIIADRMLHYGVLLMHGAAIAIGDKCFIFTAPSGTGKTTHIMNWLKAIPGTIVINGDKPFINVNTKLVFGTPWCGKEGLNTNTSSTLAGIISLERCEKNSISRVSAMEMLPVLLQQCYVPADRELAISALQLIDGLKDISFYKLKCNMDEESAVIAYKGLMNN